MTDPIATDSANLAARVLATARARAMKIITAESCTGGLIGAEFTSVAGASDVYDGGFITYSYAAKTAELGVPETMLGEHGAVSAPVARRMAEGALARSAGRAQIAISVTGIAGPGGGTEDKPVGLVWFGLAIKGQETITKSLVFKGNRETVRSQTVDYALEMILEAL